ncbi:MAG: hypothetical protein GY947_10345 [Rhodobacteraceae bacterium]|nr:hypothetical protein [Paracoccaceae bacterium]
MTDGDKNPLPPNSGGAVIRLFGVLLIILGSLNSMLSWRGGFELLSLPVFLIAAGLLLCLISALVRELRG